MLTLSFVEVDPKPSCAVPADRISQRANLCCIRVPRDNGRRSPESRRRQCDGKGLSAVKPNEGDATMKKSMLISLGISVSIAVLAAGAAISAQDKYTLQVPNGL